MNVTDYYGYRLIGTCLRMITHRVVEERSEFDKMADV